MEDNPLKPEEKIILAAIDCIEEFGIAGATNRRIAARAGVNLAAINYYFRSKEALVQRCMQVTLENAFDWKDYARLEGCSPRELCLVIFNDLLEGGCNYPGLTRAHFHGVLSQGDYTGLAVEKLNQFVGRLAAELAARGCALPPDELRLACLQMVSAVLMMILAPRLFKGSLNFDLNRSEDRRRFITGLVERLPAPAAG